MIGQRLHEFDQRLTEHALHNVRRHMTDPSFAQVVQPEIDQRLLDHIMADEDERPHLLLGDTEFEDLAFTFEAVEPVNNRRWDTDDRLLRWSDDTVMEVRRTLGDSAADEWSRNCGCLSDELEGSKVRLDEGIRLSWEWSSDLRRLLRAMGATSLLPPPAGTFPTPTCPMPPSMPTEAGQPSSPGSNTGLMAAVAEIRDMLRHQRPAKEFYSTAEVAAVLEKAEFTVREWCRLGQCLAEKMKSYRGGKKQWMVPHEELLRLQNEGPSPVATHRDPSAKD